MRTDFFSKACCDRTRGDGVKTQKTIDLDQLKEDNFFNEDNPVSGLTTRGEAVLF